MLTALILSVSLLTAMPAGAGPAPSEEAVAAPSFTDFRPSRHGFAFVNSFGGSPLPVSLGGLERRLNVPERFGLCGGMCFAAADFYLAGCELLKEIPEKEPPENGSGLYRWLYAR